MSGRVGPYDNHQHSSSKEFASVPATKHSNDLRHDSSKPKATQRAEMPFVDKSSSEEC